MDFWKNLSKPIFVLAPMADVTDDAFRRMFVRYGKPDVMFTEFVSTDGLCSVGRKNLLRELQYSPEQRPIVAQIWGANPKNFYETAKLLADMGFDGIDINLGCPQAKEVAVGACAALIRQPARAVEIIEATMKGAGFLPVSVKTRIGYDKIETEGWTKTLLSTGISALTLHGRTKKEMSKTPARWDEIAKAVRIRDEMKSETLIIGNGDVRSLLEADGRVKETKVDGVMIGRGVFGNPWFFNRDKTRESLTIKERLGAMEEHSQIFEQVFTPRKNFAVMRKHFKAYANGFPGAAELRQKVMQAIDSKEVVDIVEAFLSE